MRDLYNEFFHIPAQGKVREKVMLTRVAVSATIVILCLAVMSITAYAYFSYNVTSGSNVIKAANFEASVSISITENNSSKAVDVNKTNNAFYTAKLEAGKIYTVVLDESQSSTAKTGFCILTATGCGDTFHTQQIGADTTAENGYTDKVTFQLKATKDTTVTFLSHWGTSSQYDRYKDKGVGGRLYITNENVNDNKVLLIIDGVSEAMCDAKLNTHTEPENTPTTEQTVLSNLPEPNTPTVTTKPSVPATEEEIKPVEPGAETEPVTQPSQSEDNTDTNNEPTKPVATEDPVQPAAENTETTESTATVANE